MWNKIWYHQSRHPLTYLLLPFSWLFALAISIRRKCYQYSWIKTKRFSVPIIVVGNITVGGTGKTPFVTWLAKLLQEQGYQPGIVSRGVGGEKQVKPYRVQHYDDPRKVGDEALLLQKTGCPVVLAINRVAAVESLLRHANCDVIISDDGLQHYRLERDIEIAIVDGMRKFGNRSLLPAGPLRESLKRLKEVDVVVVNDGNKNSCSMALEPIELVSVKNNTQTLPLRALLGKKIHAVTATGNPQRFFKTLKDLGFDLIEHVFTDHYLFKKNDLYFPAKFPIVMTEKDAVKCKAFANEQYWFLRVNVKVDGEVGQKILSKLNFLEAVKHESKNDFAKNSKHTSCHLDANI